jgi:outer membrane protein assembly factor BamE (lipoprotein component of BamABCDE complex)
MIRQTAAAALTLALLGVAACTPTTSYQGFQVIDATPAGVKVGEDTKATVMAKLGSPTTSSTFDKDTWFYITQVASKTGYYKPRVTKRDIVAISFAKGGDQVEAVNTYTLKDGRVIAYNTRETPTRGREQTFLEELFGNIGSVSALPPTDQNPNTHPGQP